jgi:hypothetical protein
MEVATGDSISDDSTNDGRKGQPRWAMSTSAATAAALTTSAEAMAEERWQKQRQ